ncbi:hypothetical protein Syun_003277 [Stephania yunnanensis]|uniref:Pentatricopeptide repeat-containing protein n=1 Tax=Stephania yunnanensis TaxID=152371 RepID=A0AAP0L3G7_9MAGN
MGSRFYGAVAMSIMCLPVRLNFRTPFRGTRTFCTQCAELLYRSYEPVTALGEINEDTFEGNTRLKRLIKTGHLNDARDLFDKMPKRDAISWTTMISGYVSASNASEALVLFSNMWGVDSEVQIDPFVLALALKACGRNSELREGRVIHCYSVKTGFLNSVFVGSALLDMYTKCGFVQMGSQVFDEMTERNVVTWTSMISGLVHAGHYQEGLMYFSEMWGSDVHCDSYTFASALKACADSKSLDHGREIHCQAIKAGLDSTSFIVNTLATMYNKCGKLDYGLRLFERMKVRDVVSWTTIIATYVQMGQENYAIQTFLQMRKSGVIPNEFTLAAVISGCANLGEIEWGEQLHGHVLHMGLADSLSVANAIVVLYSKCERLDSSSMLFHGMTRRDVITWSTIIVGYSQAGHCDEAFQFFSRMRREGPKPNEVTLASLLSACGNVAILEQGKQLHALVLSLGLDEDVLINSALINMYSKCGSIVEALRIFDATGNEEIVSWTAMINGFAEHGHSKEAIDLFEKMTRIGLQPDYVTFIGVLSACSHAGLVDLGYYYFNLMSSKYKIKPGKEHYGCMVDLLCRAGRLRDAEQMILSMPFKQDDVVWSMLLRACRVQGDAECGRRTAKRILELEPNCAGTHITLCNIYSAEGMWRDAAEVRKLMRSKGVMKEPGWSWIKVKDHVSKFVADDRLHPQSEDICCMLEFLGSKSEVPDSGQELDLLCAG